MIKTKPYRVHESQLQRFQTVAYSQDVPVRHIREMASELLLLRHQMQAQAVEPAQSAIKCKDCMDTGEQLGVYGRIKCGCKEPAQSAVEPVGYISGWINGHLAIRLLDPALALSTGAALFLQPPTVPPAIPAELKDKVLELCESIIDAEDLGVLVDDVMDFNLPRKIREMMWEA